MYGLIMAASGCPMNGVQWLQGYFGLSHIKTRFCIKNNSSFTSYDMIWPTGSYCILKYGGSCPSGFQSGFIHWDNEDKNNGNARGGTLPDGVYDNDTRIYFCCRNDGRTSTAISLPTDRPFILVRLTAVCQVVFDMCVTEVLVHWDDEDEVNDSDRGGMHPYDDGSILDHRLYFCYYHG